MSKKLLSIADRAELVARARARRKILPILIAMLGTTIGVGGLIAAMYSRFASFTITVDQQQHLDYGIALSEYSDFRTPTPTITCRENMEITNIAEESIDMDIIGINDGEDHGRNYLCYTFYLKNTGQKELTYTEEAVIVSSTLGIEDAIRFRVFRTYNDNERTFTTYAAPEAYEDGSISQPESTKKFYSNSIVLKEDVVNFKPLDVMKYTILIWLEGNDTDCVDQIIGGEFKVEMKFSVDEASIIDEV